MSAGRRLGLLLALLGLLVTPPAAGARTISWSGATWDVRPTGLGAPGPNHWSDSEDSVRVEGSDLVLSIVRDADGHWTSAEVDGRTSLGYGTYRWVVETDLSDLDAHEVLGLFTYGETGPSHNEIDLEASHWGNPAWPGGSATVWQDADAGRRLSRTFAYTARPPYVHQFTWEPGRVHHLVTDGAGATLLDWTTDRDVPVPSTEVPVVNYWRFEGAPPEGVRRMRLSSFTWAPPAATPATVRTRAAARPAVAVRLGGAGATPTLRWRSTGSATLRLVVRRLRAHRAARRVALVRRPVAAGSGRVRLRGLPRGRYRVQVSARGALVDPAPRNLRFRIP